MNDARPPSDSRENPAGGRVKRPRERARRVRPKPDDEQEFSEEAITIPAPPAAREAPRDASAARRRHPGTQHLFRAAITSWAPAGQTKRFVGALTLVVALAAVGALIWWASTPPDGPAPERRVQSEPPATPAPSPAAPEPPAPQTAEAPAPPAPPPPQADAPAVPPAPATPASETAAADAPEAAPDPVIPDKDPVPTVAPPADVPSPPPETKAEAPPTLPAPEPVPAPASPPVAAPPASRPAEQPAPAVAAPPFPPRLGAITTESLDTLRRRAAAGETDAMEELARRYIEGVAVKANPVEGAKWLQLAAERGAPGAMFNVGVMFERGMVLERDPARAMEWYARASAAGVAMATHNMALMYREGAGVPTDHRRAFDMLLAAARLGMSASMFVLGTMYEAGSHGLNKDLVQAVVWYAMSMQFQRAHPATQASDLALRAEQKMNDLQGMLPEADLQRAQVIGEREYRVIIATIRAASRIPPAAPPPASPGPSTSAATPAATKPATPQAAPPATPPAPVASAPPAAAPPDAKAPPEPPAEKPVGAKDQLAEIQKLLASLRLYGGKVDGLMGPQTRKAIREYQRTNGMPQSGEPTQALAESLRKQVEKTGRR